MALIHVVLIFQLALGMAWPLAEAAVPDRQPARTSHVEHCQGDHDQAQHSKKHDCCKSLGCQCFCTYPPAIADQSTLGSLVESTHLLPADETPITTARLDELFRPPIA